MTTRRARSQALEKKLWADKRSRARGAADRAVLAFDLIRKQISQLPTGPERDAAWGRLEKHLKTFGGDGA